MDGLEVTDVSVVYDGVPALSEVSFGLAPGRVLACLGPSGCGKSTLLRAIAGLEPLARGRVSYDGRDLAGVPVHRRRFALMFQDGQLFPHRTVARNVAYPLEGRRPRPSALRERVTELLALVGLEGAAERMPETLSGGERQRVALARALAAEPRLLLLDEPLSALDRDLRERLATDVARILATAGTTAVFVTHDHEEAFAVADEMALLRDGRLVQHGTPESVWRRPVDAEAARFLGYADVLTGGAAVRIVAALGGAGPAATGRALPEVALRRSALRVTGPGSPQGPLRGTVRAATLTPEQVRLRVDVEGVGEVAAVAPLDSGVAAGSVVRLTVDPTRIALLGPASGSPGP